MTSDAGQAPGLDVSTTDGVLRLRLDRPEALNALTGEMVVGLAELLEGAVADHEVRAVLITGAGGAFSAGADIGGVDAHERFDITAMDATNRLIRAVVACDKPVVAGVNGVAAGVAAGFALVVAAESASFLLAFARIGLMPDGGTSASVAAAIGRPRAMRMALLGEPLPAPEAFDLGLVSHLVPDEGFDELVEQVLRRLAAGAPLAQAATKRAVNAASFAGLDAALERERTGQAVLMRTADMAEGMRAFGERRRPRFTGA